MANHPGRAPRAPMVGAKADLKPLGRVIRMLFQDYPAMLIAVMVCIIISAVVGILPAIYIETITSYIEDGLRLGWDGVSGKILHALVTMVCIYLAGLACTAVYTQLMAHVTQGFLHKLRTRMFAGMQKLPIRYFDQNSRGDIMSRFTNDVDNISTMLDNSVVSTISGVIQLVGTVVMMVYTNIWLTLITVAFTPLFLLGGKFIAGKSRRYYSAQQAALGAVNGYIEETVAGQKVIKVFNHEQTCEEEFEELNQDLRTKQMNAQFFGGIMGPVMGNVSKICYAFTAGIGGVLCALGKFDIGGLTIFVDYSARFSMPINELSQQVTAIFSALAGAERVFAVMDAQPETPDDTDAVDMPHMSGHVEFKDVTFGYVPDKIILKHISLYAKPGQKIAFVGSTGAGKTTITNLINRFYDINEGSITIDGVDVRKIKRDVLRKNVAMVLQDTHLFTGTVRENIRYGRPDATDDEVVQAAKTASAHSFIMKLAEGYDTVIEGDGANLSQGQRQLLNIARAAISKAPILVLDEATSSVDTRTERHIEKGMDAIIKNRTTFVIAHRLSTVRNANAIMVLENGVIIERGDHEQLLAQKGRYYELYTGVKELD